MVLVVCDLAVGPKRPLTFLVGALSPVLEGLLVTLVVSGVLMGALLAPTTAIAGVVSPASIGIVVVWTIGVYVINKVRKSPRWRITMEGSQPGRRHHRDPLPTQPHPFASRSTSQVAWIFGGACTVTLGAGVALEMSGNTLADRAGINGVVFGATVLAGATALPEISSGIAAVRLGDHALALGDIFGGNAFQLCLFLVADLIAGSPVLPTAGQPERLARVARRCAHGDLRDGGRDPAAALPCPTRARLDPRDRRLRGRDRGALRRPALLIVLGQPGLGDAFLGAGEPRLDDRLPQLVPIEPCPGPGSGSARPDTRRSAAS